MAKQQSVAARIALIDTFHKNNPELDLRRVNFFDPHPDSINWSDISQSEQSLVTKQLMAYQRVLTLAPTTADRQVLLQKGYDSALAITANHRTIFEQISGLDPEIAKQIYDLGIDMSTNVALDLAGVIANATPTHNPRVLNLPPLLANDLRRVDGYADLFGPQDFCDCEHCRSIFSPAAYFADLMYFIEKYISHPVFTSRSHKSHPLYLKNRRPDLWALQLTCENTDTLIPYLSVVNEVLESYLDDVLDENIFQFLGSKQRGARFFRWAISCNIPFNLPLEELRIYLSHFNLSLFKIYQLLNQPDINVWRARLNLSREEFDLIIKPDINNIKLRFGSPVSLVDFPIDDYQNKESGLNQRGFIRFLGISRSQLDELINLRFNLDISNIDVSQRTIRGELQNFPEILNNLTDVHLDFIHRFIRLWRKTGWSISELDMVLIAMRGAKLIDKDFGDDLSENHGSSIQHLAQLVDLQEKLKLTTEELCVLIDELPVSRSFPLPPSKLADRGLYERIFDLKKMFGESDPKTHAINTTTIYHHFSRNQANPDDRQIDPNTPLLLAGLGVSETELLLLFDLLKVEMPFDTNGDTIAVDKDGTKISTFDRRRISLLYRHARLARALRLSVEDFLHALQLNFVPDALVITTLAQIYQLYEFRDWLTSSPFTIDELRFILRGEESAMVKFCTTNNTVMQFVRKVQEVVSKDLSGLELVDRLKAHLAIFFNITVSQLEDTLKWVASDINDKSIQHVLQMSLPGTDTAVENAIQIAILLTLMQEIERVLLLFSNLKFGSETIAYVTRNPNKFRVPNSAGTAGWKSLELNEIKALTSYKNMVSLNPDLEPLIQMILEGYRISVLNAPPTMPSPPTNNPPTIPSTPTIAPPLFQPPSFNVPTTILGPALVAHTSFIGVTKLLADIWHQDESIIISLNRSLTLSAVPMEALVDLRAALELCLILGVNGYSLQNLIDDSNYAALTTARNVALGAFSAKYDDEKTRREKLEPYQDRINILKRDALADYIIAREKDLKFKNTNELYAFFLLDIEMDGCFRTSRVVAGISSLQLYGHRILVHLEQSDPNLNPDIDNITVDPTIVPPEDWQALVTQWEWRKNYRVWEANRKVFLYPENYIEPDLRDNKTPIFKELEDELLQKKISKESVEEAYKKYLAQFAEVARLRNAGSYYHGETNTYYFFSRTQQDPPQYYFRKWIDSKTWTPWEKIELGISAPSVSAVIHHGKLYIFWVDVLVKEKHQVVNGSSLFDGFEFELTINYSYMKENGKWLTINKVKSWKEKEWIRLSKESGISENVINLIDKLKKLLSAYKYAKKRPQPLLIYGDYSIGIAEIGPIYQVDRHQSEEDKIVLDDI